MCLLYHDFQSEYDIMLSAWGEGVLRESGLLDLQKPHAIFKAYQKKYHNRNGSVQIKEDIRSPGTSASNTLGGSFYYSLPKDFYLTKTAEEIAGMFRSVLHDAILQDGRLAAFLQKANTHSLYQGKN